VRVLLVSTYELGHQPLHVAIPAAALRERGHEVRCLDLAVDSWDPALAEDVDAVAVSVPMHTATRLAVEVAASVHVRTCAYGLYAAAASGFDRAIGGEYLPELVAWVEHGGGGTTVDLGRHHTPVPARDLLPPLDRYAKLVVGGEERLAGAIEASHGCASQCRHCPVAGVYEGRTRIVAQDVLLADVAQLVEMGARHLTFADPDFLSAPAHSRRVVRAIHERWPDLTFDITTKIELILRHEHLWPELAGLGCLFVTTALECVDDEVLALLDKGHTASDAARAVTVLRDVGIEPRPSLLPFSPWTTIEALRALVEFVADNDLAANVEPVHWTIRLLVPPGSLLLRHHEFGAYDPDALAHPWTSDLDDLQAELAVLVDAMQDRPAAEVFLAVAEVLGRPVGPVDAGLGRPRLTEAWFCCAEPTCDQVASLR
jgi:hypothetical protein